MNTHNDAEHDRVCDELAEANDLLEHLRDKLAEADEVQATMCLEARDARLCARVLWDWVIANAHYTNMSDAWESRWPFLLEDEA